MSHEITLIGVPGDGGEAQRHVFHYPSGWDDPTLEARHLEAVCKAHASGATDTEKRFTLLQELAGIPDQLMARMPPAADLMLRVDTTDRSGPWRPKETFEWQLLPSLNWAFAPPKYERSLLREVEHEGKRWLGPWDQFDHMTLSQWTWCCTLLKGLRGEADKAKQAHQLDLFLGAVFVPAPEGPRNDKADHAARAAWSNDPIEEHAATLATLPLHRKLAAVLNFEALHALLPVAYWRVFDPDGETQQSPQGLFGMAYSVAESGVFGDLYRSDAAPLHRVLGYMEDKLYKDEQAAAKAKQNSK